MFKSFLSYSMYFPPLNQYEHYLQLIQHMMRHSTRTVFLCVYLSPHTYWLCFFLIGVGMNDKAIWPLEGWFSLGTSLWDASVVLIWYFSLPFLSLVSVCFCNSLFHSFSLLSKSRYHYSLALSSFNPVTKTKQFLLKEALYILKPQDFPCDCTAYGSTPLPTSYMLCVFAIKGLHLSPMLGIVLGHRHLSGEGGSRGRINGWWYKDIKEWQLSWNTLVPELALDWLKLQL